MIPEADLQAIAGSGPSRLAVMCGFLGILAVATAAFQAIQSLMVLRIEGRISATLIPAVWERLLRLPSRFFAGFSSGDLALRAMGLSEVFKRASGAVVTSIVTGVFSLFNLALLYAYSWRLAMVTTLLAGAPAAGDDPAAGRPAPVRGRRSAGSTGSSRACCWSSSAGSSRCAARAPRAAPWRGGPARTASGSGS